MSHIFSLGRLFLWTAFAKSGVWANYADNEEYNRFYIASITILKRPKYLALNLIFGPISVCIGWYK